MSRPGLVSSLTQSTPRRVGRLIERATAYFSYRPDMDEFFCDAHVEKSALVSLNERKKMDRRDNGRSVSAVPDNAHVTKHGEGRR